MSKGIFTSFNENAKLFDIIENENPIWWQNIIEDKELYVELRKDNYINVYYYGGCVAKISYQAGVKAEIHNKYLDKPIKVKNTYVDCLREIESKDEIDKIKLKIKEVYLKAEKIEKEKKVQGDLILSNRKYIDSELAYSLEGKIIRIDLIELDNGLLTFVELKLIGDYRLNKREGEPEIVNQMNKYSEFISDYKDEVIPYYQKLLSVKKRLGIIDDVKKIDKLNMKPLLLIFNNYDEEISIGKKKRIEEIIENISNKDIDYKFISDYGDNNS
ncbi:MAG: hypothetical protein WC135_02285 [Bacteroidales bacterium]